MTHVDNTFKSPINAISIGPGIRGIERGVERVIAIRELIFLEVESFIIENLVCQMEQGLLAPALIWANAKTFDARPFRGIIDILFAGFPCQPFSVAGNRKGSDDPRHLWPTIGKGEESIIGILRPPIVFLENVPGLLTLGYQEVREDLLRLGYAVEEGIFSAEETGATHRRERLFILAIRRDYLEHASKLRFNNEQKGFDKVGGDEERNIQVSTGERNAEQRGTEQSSSDGEELGDTSCLHLQGCERGQRQEQSGRTSDEPSIELAHPEHNGQPSFKEFRSDETASQERRKEESEISWESQGESRSIDECCLRGSEDRSQLANTNSTGSQRRNGRELQECAIERIAGKRNPSVARPGQPQHEWESPRTTIHQWETKSGMGGAIDGYKFREDFLRALGNSVYEDTAELAFRTLSTKLFGGIDIYG